ncbi:uncharacterized protein LOC135395866 [Ornithodoros turicata]|uniref:uncharacterized protein LOC135395866 n=1 Tax=Ornithodoros turicata TaxID=34597 RepID=UPI00313A088D
MARSTDLHDGEATGDLGTRTEGASDSGSAGQEVHASVLDKLRLEIELYKAKMQFAQAEHDRSSTSSRPSTSRSRVGDYARDLKGVLTAMPETEALVPAWFTAVETIFTNFDVPEDVQGPVLLLFGWAYLNEKMRAVIARHGNGQILDYEELKQKVLTELRLTPGEYKRLFFHAKKGDSESWSQFTTRLESLFDHYVTSRKVKSQQDLRDLVIADRLKAVMPEDTRSYLMLTEADTWFKPSKLAELAENFDDSKKGAKHQKNQNLPWDKKVLPGTKEKQSSANYSNGRQNSQASRNTSRGSTVKCYGCGELGHYKSHCPQTSVKTGKAESRASSTKEKGEDNVVAKVSLLCKEVRDSQGLTNKEPPTVRLCIDDKVVNARLDSGADVTVIRKDVVPDKFREKGSQEVKLKGAFGHLAEAELMEVPLGLQAERECAQQVMTLCAVTDELSVGVDVLLTPEDYEEIKHVKQTLEKEAEAMAKSEESVESSGIPRAREEEQVSFEDEENENEENGTPLELSVNVAEGIVENEMSMSVESRKFALEQREDESLKESWEQANEGTHGMVIEGGLLYHEEKNDLGVCKQLVLPTGRRKEVLSLAHDSPWGGHFSMKKTKQRVKSAFYWPSVVSDIRKHCQSCHSCQIFSRSKETDRVPITPLTRPEKPFEMVFIDCIGPLDPPSARGHKYALSIVDLSTRWPEVIPLRSLTAKATCQALVEVFARYGTPELICCDQGTNFTSKLTQELTAKMGVKMRFSTPDHPQSNGLVERWNGTFKAMLKHVIETKGREWDKYVPCLIWAYREVPNEITGTSPFELMFGRMPNGPLSILKQTWAGDWTPPTGLNKPASTYLAELRERMASMAKEVSERTATKQKEYASRYNLRTRSKVFKAGGIVLVLETERSSKLQPKWKGPATVKEKKREDSYVVTLEDGTERWVHANKLRPYMTRVNAVGVIFEEDEEFGSVSTLPQPTSGTAQKGVGNISSHLTAAQRSELENVISKFQEVFDDKPGKCKVGCHRIQLENGAKLGKAFPYKVPVALRQEVDRQVEELLKWGLILPG